MQERRRRCLTLAIISMVVLPVVACRPPGALKRRGANSVILLPVRGVLMDLVVFGQSRRVMWRIVPESQSASTAGPIGELVYGVTPPGYRQVIPKDGAPPPVAPNDDYECWVVMRDPSVGVSAYLHTSSDD
ncbi:MAG TPA: hypothetical protein VLZ81_17190 [Blastocatellia bacterium]|nr:hypothetical protein [Blastocatellia bacterium]